MSHDDNQKSSRASGAMQAVIVVVTYLIPFFIVLADELVFRTFLFSKYCGEWGSATFRMVYFPFFAFFHP